LPDQSRAVALNVSSSSASKSSADSPSILGSHAAFQDQLPPLALSFCSCARSCAGGDAVIRALQSVANESTAAPSSSRVSCTPSSPSSPSCLPCHSPNRASCLCSCACAWFHADDQLLLEQAVDFTRLISLGTPRVRNPSSACISNVIFHVVFISYSKGKC
jgi:hypothetical protein